MKKLLVILSVLGLVGCSNVAPNIPNPFTPSGPTWTTQSGVPTNGNSVDFTQSGPPWLNYLTKKVQGIPAGSALSITYTITTTGNPVFDYRTKADNTCGKGSPGTVRLFFQRYGDNFSGEGPYQQYRYWSQVAFKELSPGTHTLTATLDPSKWSDVYGKRGSDYPDQFNQAVAYAENVGVTFGGGCFFGHGVKVVGGTATFTVNAFVP
jgi:hypothetical protein